jgi:hypothetical protein
MNAGDRCMTYMTAKVRMQKLGIHASETAWVGTSFDHILDNNDTIDDLYLQVKSLVLENPVSIGTLPYAESSGNLHTLS